MRLRMHRAAHVALRGVSAAALVCSRLLLRISPGRLIRWAAEPSRSRLPITPGADRLVNALAHAVACANGSYTCLERAAALRIIVGPLCTGARVVIGVCRSDGSLRAHAWLERPGASHGRGAAGEGLTPLPFTRAA